MVNTKKGIFVDFCGYHEHYFMVMNTLQKQQTLFYTAKIEMKNNSFEPS